MSVRTAKPFRNLPDTYHLSRTSWDGIQVVSSGIVVLILLIESLQVTRVRVSSN